MQFEDLNDDCWLDVLKYLDLKERLVYEAVTKSSRNAITRLWHAQRSLIVHIGKKPVSKVKFCQCKRHILKEEDAIYVSSVTRPKAPEQDCIYQVLRRCPNLTTLVWEGKHPKWLSALVMDNCRHLEHAEGLSNVIDKLPVKLEKLICCEAKGFRMVKYLIANYELRNLYLNYDMKDADVDLLMKHEWKCEIPIRTTLYTYGFESNILDNLVQIKALKIVNIGLVPRFGSLPIEKLPPQVEISWNWIHSSDQLLIELFKHSGTCLQRVNIDTDMVDAKICTALAKFCPNLSMLQLRHDNPFDDYEQLKTLKKLRFLSIIKRTFSPEFVDQLLAACPKVRVLEVILNREDLEFGKQMFLYSNAHARRHPSKSIHLICHLRSLTNEEPLIEALKAEGIAFEPNFRATAMKSFQNFCFYRCNLIEQII